MKNVKLLRVHHLVTVVPSKTCIHAQGAHTHTYSFVIGLCARRIGTHTNVGQMSMTMAKISLNLSYDDSRLEKCYHCQYYMKYVCMFPVYIQKFTELHWQDAALYIQTRVFVE